MPLRVHLLSLAAATFVVGIILTQPILPLYLEGKGLGTFEVALLVGILFPALVVTEVGAPLVTGRIGRRGAIALACLGGAAMQVWFTFADSRPEWYASRMLFGALRGLLWPITFAEVADAAPAAGRGRAFATFWLYFGVGLLVGPFLGGWVADLAGMRATLLLSALLTLAPLAFLGAFSVYRDPSGSLVAAMRALAGIREVRVVWILMVIHTGVYSLFSTFLPLYAARYRLTPYDIGVVFSVSAAAFAVAQVPAGRLLDRLDVLSLVWPAFVARGLAIAAVTLAHGFGSLLAVGTVIGVVGALVPSALSVRLAAVTPQDRLVTGMGGFNAVADIGFFMGPVIGGAVAGADLRWPFLLAAPLSAGALLLMRSARAEAPVT